MLFKKIKINYFNKLFEELIKKNDFEEIRRELNTLKKNNLEYYFFFLNKVLNMYLNNDQGQHFFLNRILWLNSFDLSDLEIIKNFLFFYIQTKKSLDLGPNIYSHELSTLHPDLRKKKIQFEDLIENSYLYQYEILQLNPTLDKILLNNHVFFEKLPNKYFTHYYLCRCFIYVVRNPIDLYTQYKTLSHSHQNALNILNGLEALTPPFKDFDNLPIENTTKDWSTNVLSWTNRNVMNTFRGLLIKYEDLILNPRQVLAETISHLVQSGIDLEMDYALIDQFIKDNNPIFSQTIPENFNISNQEKKKIQRELGETPSAFHYNF